MTAQRTSPRFWRHALMFAVVPSVAAGFLVVPSGGSDVSVASIQPLLRFEADGLEAAKTGGVFVNGVEVAKLLQSAAGWQLVTVPIPAERLSSGINEISIIAGRGPAMNEDFDQFMVRDVRLDLDETTEIRDPRFVATVPMFFGGKGNSHACSGQGANIVEPATVIAALQDEPHNACTVEKYLARRDFLFDVPLKLTAESMPAQFPVGGAHGSSDAKPLNGIDGEREAGLGQAELSALSATDGVVVTTTTNDQGFAFQRYSLAVNVTVPFVQVTWEGRTGAGEGATLWVYDHQLLRWRALADIADASMPTILTGMADTASTARQGTVQVAVTSRRAGTILRGCNSLCEPLVGSNHFTIAWLTDTQFVSTKALRENGILTSQIQWIVKNQDALKIVYVTLTGDLMEDHNFTRNQMESISLALRPLDEAGVPYGVLPGNHDYLLHRKIGYEFGLDPTTPIASSSVAPQICDPQLSLYCEFFGVDRFSQYPWYGGFFRNNENHYDLISAGGEDFLMLHLGYQLFDEEIKWAQGILDNHPNHRVILNVHSYLNVFGGHIEDGRPIFDRLVVPNSQVFMVLAGHISANVFSVVRDDDRVTLELVHNYQNAPNGGGGFQHVLHFDLDRQQLTSEVYSPYVDSYRFRPTSAVRAEAGMPRRQQDIEFTIPLLFRKVQRTVVTDRVAAQPGSSITTK